jgi:hypothetical protein
VLAIVEEFGKGIESGDEAGDEEDVSKEYERYLRNYSSTCVSTSVLWGQTTSLPWPFKCRQ